jgi:hypothetical protein
LADKKEKSIFALAFEKWSRSKRIWSGKKSNEKESQRRLRKKKTIFENNDAKPRSKVKADPWKVKVRIEGFWK